MLTVSLCCNSTTPSPVKDRKETCYYNFEEKAQSVPDIVDKLDLISPTCS